VVAHAHDAARGAKIQLLGAFNCSIGGVALDLPSIPSALIAHLCLTGRAMARRSLEQSLWPGLGAPAASKRMRQVLWRIRSATDGRLLITTDTQICLDDAVTVDWERAEEDAHRVTHEGADLEEIIADRAAWRSLTKPLLPDHNCPSVRATRLRWNHLRLSALRRLAENALSRGDTLLAVELATAAIVIDELSEWPYQIIAHTYLARHDIGLAARVLSEYSDLLRLRFNLSPSSNIRAQIQKLGAQSFSAPPTVGSSR
jgi:DNA-binding SARP family transcriptional activator